jgi:RNA polymerase sigma-70 factor (ECF subfamily)
MRLFCFKQALRVVSCPVTADEAAQEAIIRAWRNRDRCRHPDQPFGWLARIARNEALRLVTRRPNEVLVAEPLASAPSRVADDATAASLLLGDVMASLSPADRELARLRYYEDLTCADVADHLGASEATVKVRLHRLRRRLRQKMEDEK